MLNGAKKTTRQQFTPRDIELVDDLARPDGLFPLQLDGVGLVTELDGTGSDPPPSAERSLLMAEMQRRRVAKAGELLASPDTALVLVRAIIPPGAQRGDRLDVEVTIPANTDTTSLRGGWLMLTPLKEHALINGRPATGHTFALGQGSIVIESLLGSGADETQRTRGKILGGGKVLTARPIGLRIREAHTSARTSHIIGTAINRRFFVYDHGTKRGVADPKNADYISILVHPRYHHNVLRYMRVVQNIVVRQSADEARARLDHLRSQLSRPSSSALAAIGLEAIGKEGIPILLSALDSSNEEIRFYAAEALGYMNQEAAAPVLAQAAANEPAFRWRALSSLGAMDHPAAHEALFGLLDCESAETRYGAFRELRRLIPTDPAVAGTVLGGDILSVHQVACSAEPLVHVAKEERPEITIFGSKDIHLQTPFVLFAGPRIVVRGHTAKDVTISRLSAGEEDESQPCSTRLVDIIRGIVDLRGSYPDVVQALAEAKKTAALPTRLEFSAIPELGRTYHRDQPDGPSSQEPPPDESLPVTELTAN